MGDILIKIIPVILIFLLGYILKRVNILKKEDGDLFLKLVFYVALPALIILSIAKIDLRPDFVYLPIVAALIIPATTLIAFWIGKLLQLQRSTLGTFIVGSAIMNIGFTLPFFIAAYGEEGLARASLFDFGNGLLTYTFVYYFACKFGTSMSGQKAMIKKFFASPPIWALIVALILNLANIAIPTSADTFLQLIGGLTAPLIMLSLGIYFSPRLVKIAPVISATFIRMILGFALGFILVKLFDLEGLNKLVVLIGAAAPVGYNTLTFSSLENLDKEFAASLVSFSILVGIIFIPILMLFLF